MPHEERETLFEVPDYRAVELGVGDIPTIQLFLEKNPEYFLSAEGEPPGAGQAKEEFESELPEGWAFTKRWAIGILGKEGEVEAFVTIVSDMLTPGAWHIGMFILSTHKHGQGVATRIFEGLEAWLKTFGARWLRLGVIEGNDRAERFWERSGFSEVRRRDNVPMKNMVHSLRVMVKPLTKASLSEYLKVVTRDRPDSP